MTEYEKWKYYYAKGWATKTQLRTVVEYGKITPKEYEEITGETYVSPVV